MWIQLGLNFFCLLYSKYTFLVENKIMNQVKISITHFLAQAYLPRLTNIKSFTNCCQPHGGDEIDCKSGNCITSELVVSFSAY